MSAKGNETQTDRLRTGETRNSRFPGGDTTFSTGPKYQLSPSSVPRIAQDLDREVDEF